VYFLLFCSQHNLKFTAKIPPKWGGDPLPTPLAPALHTRARLSPQIPFLDPPIYLAKIGLLHRSPPSLRGSLFYVHNHVGAVVRTCNYHTHALRHVREHLTTETAQTRPAASSCHGSTILQLTAVWRSCCSRRKCM